MSILDRRSGKIILVSHRILNMHSREDDLATYPGLDEGVVSLLVQF
jgi:hypothetical protein